MFRGTRGNGVDIYNAWVNGVDVTSTDATCMKLKATTCVDHYRSPSVDTWDSLGITEVRVVF